MADLLGVSLERVESWLDLHTLPSMIGPEGRQIRRVDLQRFAEPLIEPDVFDQALGDDPTEATQIIGMQAATAGLSQLFAARRFDRESRVRPLFHYTSAATALDYVLVERRLRLNPPSGMNDPFESDPYWVSFSGEWDGDPDELLRLSADASGELRDRCRMACLTRSGPNSWASLVGYGNGYMRARMWAQYADGHSGVCLALDHDALRMAARRAERSDVRLFQGPVRYRTEEDREILIQLPLTSVQENLAEFVEGMFPSVVAGLYFSKAWDWSSESEYRFLLYGDVDEYEYIDIRAALTGVFCGPRFPIARFADLRARCPELWEAGRIFRMVWRNGLATPMPVQQADDDLASWQIPPAPVDPPS